MCSRVFRRFACGYLFCPVQITGLYNYFDPGRVGCFDHPPYIRFYGCSQTLLHFSNGHDHIDLCRALFHGQGRFSRFDAGFIGTKGETDDRTGFHSGAFQFCNNKRDMARIYAYGVKTVCDGFTTDAPDIRFSGKRF